MNKSAWERLLAGWPIYSAIIVGLFFFSELWIDKKITDGIDTHTGKVPAITAMALALATTSLATTHNTNLINKVDAKVEEVERDTKAILLHLAGD